jgi:hypothetical protein
MIVNNNHFSNGNYRYFSAHWRCIILSEATPSTYFLNCTKERSALVRPRRSHSVERRERVLAYRSLIWEAPRRLPQEIE